MSPDLFTPPQTQTEKSSLATQDYVRYAYEADVRSSVKFVLFDRLIDRLIASYIIPYMANYLQTKITSNM